jgi:peptide/nickel transport system permease protein
MIGKRAAGGRFTWRARSGSDRVYILCLVVLAIVIACTILAPLIAPYNPNQIFAGPIYQGPSVQHLFGTDGLGRDIFSRVLYGGRFTLLGATLIVGISSTAGLAVATASAWLGGRLDAAVSRALDVLFAFPGLLLAILTVSVFGPGFIAPVLALAVAYMPYMARLTRSVAIRERTKPYIDTCIVQGFSGMWICVRHLVPNLMPFVIVQATVSFGYAIIDLASLSFIGLGIQPPTADWGLMVSDGETGILAHHPEESLFSGLMIVVTVVAFVIAGERRGAVRGRYL